MRIYRAENRFWAIAINSQCSSKDLKKSLAEINHLNTSSAVSLHVVDKTPAGFQPVREVKDEEIISEVKGSWTKAQNYFFLASWEDSPPPTLSESGILFDNFKD